MPYLCFVESEILTVPHMEPLAADNERDAAEEARRLLATHSSGIAAHVFFGEMRVATVRKDAVVG